MTKVDIFSGFLGAGKTTLIKKLIAEALQGEKLVLIENEFGEIGIDGGFMKESGIQVNELNAGCICCSLVGDFTAALHEVLDTYHPDRILIEPSGVGKLSDILKAVSHVGDALEINSATVVADAGKCKRYMRAFGEFYNDQISGAGAIVLSRTGGMDAQKLAECVKLLREVNPEALIITTPWDELRGEQILNAIQHTDTLAHELEKLRCEQAHHAHDDDDDDDEDDAHEHAHHHHDHGEDEHHHHHHDHDDDDDDDDDAHEHHDHGPDCTCGCHDHDHDHEHHHHHHHDHDADEIFVSWGVETAKKFTEDELRRILGALEDEARFGTVLRAKGIVDAADGAWIHFDYVPGETDIRRGSAEVTGRLCVIGSELKENALRALLGLETA